MRQVFCFLLIQATFLLSAFAQNDSQMLIEDWETGDFTSLQWERPGNQYKWEITSEGAHSGRYCARSGNYYTKNTESVLQLSVYLNENGTLSYFRKIFSSENSGNFYFYIDGVLKETLSGYADWSASPTTTAAPHVTASTPVATRSAAQQQSSSPWAQVRKLLKLLMNTFAVK